MAKLNQAGFDKFSKNIPSSVKAFLSYGNDEGLVFETAQEIAKKINPNLDDPFNVEELTSAKIKDDAGALYMAATSTSLMGGQKLVIIKDATDTITNAVKDFLELNSDAFLVMFGTGLTRKSSLVQLTEGSDFAMALGCYADDMGALRQLIKQMLDENSITINEEAMSYLISKLGADRKMTRSEMNKLITYMGDDKTLTPEIAIACIDDASAVSFENLTDAIYAKNPKGISEGLQKLYGEGESEIAIIRIVASFFKRYIPAYKVMEDTGSVTNAIANIRPKPNFKQEAKVKAGFRNWNIDKINRALDILVDAEINCKTTNYPLSQICERALLQIINLR